MKADVIIFVLMGVWRGASTWGGPSLRGKWGGPGTCPELDAQAASRLCMQNSLWWYYAMTGAEATTTWWDEDVSHHEERRFQVGLGVTVVVVVFVLTNFICIFPDQIFTKYVRNLRAVICFLTFALRLKSFSKRQLAFFWKTWEHPKMYPLELFPGPTIPLGLASINNIRQRREARHWEYTKMYQPDCILAVRSR